MYPLQMIRMAYQSDSFEALRTFEPSYRKYVVTPVVYQKCTQCPQLSLPSRALGFCMEKVEFPHFKINFFNFSVCVYASWHRDLCVRRVLS